MQCAGEECREPVRKMKDGPRSWNEHVQHGIEALAQRRPGKIEGGRAVPLPPDVVPSHTGPTLREALRRPNTAGGYLPWPKPNLP
jgi:hypothetical protein